MGEHAVSVIAQLDIMARDMMQRWCLGIKPSSHEIVARRLVVLVRRGSLDPQMSHACARSNSLRQRLLASHGACAERSYGDHCGPRQAVVGPGRFLSLLACASLSYVECVFDTFCILWPYSRSLELVANQLQRRMCSILRGHGGQVRFMGPSAGAARAHVGGALSPGYGPNVATRLVKHRCEVAVVSRVVQGPDCQAPWLGVSKTPCVWPAKSGSRLWLAEGVRMAPSFRRP